MKYNRNIITHFLNFVTLFWNFYLEYLTNFVEKIDKKDAINLIFNQVYMPKDSVALANTLQLIDRLLSCCNLWKIHCNMEPEAAKIAYEAILNNKE